jgi:Phosphatidylinositol-glycan biosynthesis class S protein
LPPHHSSLRWEAPFDAETNETSPQLQSIHTRSFYERLFFIRTIWSRLSSILKNTDQIRSIVHNHGHRWTIESVDAKPLDSDRLKSAVIALMQNEQYFAMLSLLQRMEDQLEQWFQVAQPIPRVITDFPREQYAAILGPLLFPLLVPLVAAFVREYRRYRKMIRKT